MTAALSVRHRLIRKAILLMISLGTLLLRKGQTAHPLSTGRIHSYSIIIGMHHAELSSCFVFVLRFQNSTATSGIIQDCLQSVQTEHIITETIIIPGALLYKV